MADTTYDLVIIGGGVAGYVAAIRASQLGIKTACVEMRGRLGGTCLNVGCIPSKALLQSSEIYEETKSHLAVHGVGVGNVSLDLAAMLGRKDKVVEDLTKGVEFLFRKNKVDYIKGRGRIAGHGRVEVALEGGGNQSLTAKSICIATGSESSPLPGITVDEKRIVTSTGALSLNPVPGHLIVIGAGYIGLEMGSVWRRLGSKVTVVEYLDRILPGMDGEIAKSFQRILQKQGFEFRLGMKVTGAEAGANGVKLSMVTAAGGDAASLDADVVLLCVGRRAFTEGLGLETVSVAKDERGRIKTDRHFATNVPGIYAIGDVIAGPMLAHKSEEEGIALAEILAGQAGHVNYETVPGVVYTHPEVATVGKTEEELKAAGVAYKVGKFPITANSRARCAGDTEGLVKIIADAKTDRLLGCHIISADAGTMIHEAVMAMEFQASAEDVARAFHAHPTLNEAVKEAALAVDGRAIHI
ncbi:dihydrolipoyl dehydrogenase [Hypericibacter sp.]|uniref:dihydrolipoyl dehydrogenase n=1 Tax=Hypericibacter sp. TaxID=2705401 RepID=UPI003D6CB557